MANYQAAEAAGFSGIVANPARVLADADYAFGTALWFWMTPRSAVGVCHTAAVQGDLWSARAQDWADVQELTQRPLYTSILQEVMQGPHTNLLDVGCGSGLFTAMAAAASRVSGIDAAGALLAIAKRRTPQAEFRVGDMEALPYDSRTFDLVTGINSFQFAANPVNALAEARRVGQAGLVCWALGPDGGMRHLGLF